MHRDVYDEEKYGTAHLPTLERGTCWVEEVVPTAIEINAVGPQ